MYKRVDLLDIKYYKITYHNNAIAYKFGKSFHRVDGPAVIQENGTEEWLYMGKLHRLDGPARTIVDNTVITEWWVDGHKVNECFPKWAKDNNITYPFTEEQNILFKLRWVNYDH